MNKNLLIIGAGPKALAIHTKACVLREIGRDAPNIIIVEKSQIGANWSGGHGYTDGRREVVTPADKDLGYPYRSTFGSEIDRRMIRFSWHAFQVARGSFAKWIDDDRPSISHRDLAQYLAWAADQSHADVRVGSVKTGIRCEGNEWIVPYVPLGRKDPVVIRASGLVITGPGKARSLPGRQSKHACISDSESFWLDGVQENLRDVEDGHIAIVGAGDTAAAAVVTLLEVLPRPNKVKIHVYCGGGIPFSRNDSRGEDKFSSNPGMWETYEKKFRLEFLGRTQRGVFSRSLKAIIDAAENEGTVIYEQGFVWDAEGHGKKIRLTLNKGSALLPKPERIESLHFRRVVVATGFKRYGFEDWFDTSEIFGPRACPPDTAPGNYDPWRESLIADQIKSDLSYFNTNTGFPNAKLYLPTFSGLNCGPGFQTLGCLGLVSDRIIESHLGALAG